MRDDNIEKETIKKIIIISSILLVIILIIDNCIISNEIYDKFKSNDLLYNIIFKDYSKLSNLSAKENYNINKSLQLKLVKEDDSYADYYAMTCGFKNKDELLKYTKVVIKLANKVK